MINDCKQNVSPAPPLELRCRLANQSQTWAGRNGGMAGFLGVLLLCLAFGQAVNAGQSARLIWAASADPSVIGYNVHYGGESGNYTNVVSVGMTPTALVSGLVAGATYYFAVTAFDAFGNESAFSNEASYVVPSDAMQLQINTSSGQQFSLTGVGQAGHTYEIQATTDLVNWITLGTQTAGTDGLISFTDYDSPNYPARFYRTHDTQP